MKKIETALTVLGSFSLGFFIPLTTSSITMDIPAGIPIISILVGILLLVYTKPFNQRMSFYKAAGGFLLGVGLFGFTYLVISYIAAYIVYGPNLSPNLDLWMVVIFSTCATIGGLIFLRKKA